jgi:hypothetical protein
VTHLLPLIALLGCTGDPVDSAVVSDPATYTTVFTSLSFSRRNEDQSTVGFDLDGHVSDAGDDEGCGHADLVDPNGVPGIDSAFSGMVPALEATEAAAVAGLIQDSIQNGQLVLLVELSGVDDPVNDDCVDVRVIRGAGTPMIGTDGVMLDGQTFGVLPGSTPSELTCIPLVDGAIDAGPFALTLDFQVLDVALSFHMTGASIHLALSPDGRTATGYFGGYVPVADILVIVDEGDLADIADLVRSLVNAAADLAPNEEGTCDAISVVFDYGGIEAFVGE